MKKDFAILFDLNGTVVDTEIAHSSSYKEVLREYGLSFTVEKFTDHWTRQGKKIDEYLIKIGRGDLVPQSKEIKRKKDVIFRETIADLATLVPGVVELLERLKDKKMKIGLESSSPWANVEKVITHYNVKSYFDQFSVLDSGLDESIYGPAKKKSSRLKYLAYLMKFPPNKCVLLGDAEKDMIGAKEAGMKSVAVPTQYTKNNNFEHADKVLASYKEVTLELLESLFNH
ncbi:HAD family hydrolase [Patescibacteria group bacterium]